MEKKPPPILLVPIFFALLTLLITSVGTVLMPDIKTMVSPWRIGLWAALSGVMIFCTGILMDKTYRYLCDKI
jgi:hypothetical protein